MKYEAFSNISEVMLLFFYFFGIFNVLKTKEVVII